MRGILNSILGLILLIAFVYFLSRAVDYYYDNTIGNTPEWLVDFMRSETK